MVVPLPYGDGYSGPRRKWTDIKELVTPVVDDEPITTWLRARIEGSRCKGKLGFLTLRYGGETAQAIIEASSIGDCGKDFVKFAGGIPLESIIDINAEVVSAFKPVLSCTKSTVELKVKSLFVVSRAAEVLPFTMRDANESEANKQGDSIRVELSTRLDNRIMDLRTTLSRSIFRIQAEVCEQFRIFLRARGFTEIHSPKLLGGASEGGSSIFDLKYFGRDACLAQSPQLYKQMALCGDMDRVFEIGPVFRAENSNTHRHLCEFVGLDMEMTIKEDYVEALDLMGKMFNHIFLGIRKSCADEISYVSKYFGVKEFAWSEDKPLVLTYEEGMDMLRDDGADIPKDILEFDMGTTDEKRLGQLVFDKHGTDFFMMIDYPQAIRPFYTHPNPDKPGFSRSYDFFMRGEEIVSGAQRIHDADLLTERAAACGIAPSSISSYIDAFRLGAFPHAGCGIGLERVVMLYLGLGNIRRASLFPRDPKRLTP